MDDPYDAPRRPGRADPAVPGRVEDRDVYSDEEPRETPRVHLGTVAITPTRVILAIALIGSVLFGLYALTVRDATQIPLLASGAAVLGLVFSALTISGVISTYRAGSEGRGLRATLLAVGSGISSIIALVCFAGAIVLGLIWTAKR